MRETICPHCQQPIYDDEALLCHFCGESLRRSGSGLMGNMKYGKKGLLAVIVVILMILSFALLFLL